MSEKSIEDYKRERLEHMTALANLEEERNHLKDRYDATCKSLDEAFGELNEWRTSALTRGDEIEQLNYAIVELVKSMFKLEGLK